MSCLVQRNCVVFSDPSLQRQQKPELILPPILPLHPIGLNWQKNCEETEIVDWLTHGSSPLQAGNQHFVSKFSHSHLYFYAERRPLQPMLVLVEYLALL